MSGLRLALSLMLLMVICISVTEALRGTGPKKCCFRFNNSPVARDRITSYTKTSQRCSNPAVLLRTIAGRQLCVRPSDSWVQEIMSFLDAAASAGETSPL